ncbi:MAG: response regulator transcription factor [Duodenibacillus sp.]|nr:response regulator transcription factor [Duodenibacillus sp.]
MPNENMLIRVVDDDDMLRRAMEFMLTCNGFDVRVYESARQFLTQDHHSTPGCVILDVQMPDMNGLELQEEMINRNITLPVIFLSAHADFPKAVQAFKNGALDFLQKPLDEESFLKTLDKVLDKERVKLGLIRDQDQDKALVDKLSKRELQIARLVASGLSKKLVAERLGISEKTVEAHGTSIYSKLNVHSAAELNEVLTSSGTL